MSNIQTRSATAPTRLKAFRLAVLFLITFSTTACTVMNPTPKSNTVNLQVSQNDSRDYKLLTLSNQLSVLLISDPDADKAAAAMNVAVGSREDPDNFPGLAHFLEHMLFLGTEKYPEAGEYQTFITKHGGSHNAFTSYLDTNYFFEVDSNALEPALDRFAQFFIAPLFSEAYVQREKNAVHSEYQSKLRDDGRKQFDILKQVLNPEHPYSRFSTGSLETLSDKETSARQAMIEFYRSYYSADRMSLVVMGKETPEQLEKMVKTRFSTIERHQIELNQPEPPLFKSDQLPLQLDIHPLQARHTLKLQFPMPEASRYFDKKPASYLANLIGHEGEGSLLSYLKQQGWATGLSAGSGISTSEEMLFTIAISLTEAGFQNYDAVTNAVFGYIDLIRAKGIEKWRFSEQSRLSQIAFDFMEPASPIHYVSNLAYSMRRYPHHQVLYAPYAMDDFDEKLIRSYLAYLTPDNLLLTRIGPDLETDRVSPWFKGDYRIRPLTKDQIRPITPTAFRLPGSNPFIPDALTIRSLPIMDKPLDIASGSATLWYMADTQFKTPKTEQYFSLQSPLSSRSARDAALTHLLAAWLNEVSNEFAYPASLAGLDYQLYKHMRGITLQMGGYDQRQSELLSYLLQRLTTYPVDAEHFELVKQSLIKRWKNADKAPLYRQLMQHLSDQLMQPTWSEHALLASVTPLTASDLEHFRQQFLSQLHIDAMIIGNISQADALSSLQQVTDILKPSLNAQDVPRPEIVPLTKGRQEIQADLSHNDNGWLAYYQAGQDDYTTQAQWLLLSQILQSPYYHEMRTQQQLGYVVFANYHPVMTRPGLSLLVQSPGHTPQQIEALSQKFLQQFVQELKSMPAQELMDHKAGLLARLLDKDDRLQARAQRLWREMALDETHFERRERLAQAIEKVNAEEVLSILESISTMELAQIVLQYQPKS